MNRDFLQIKELEGELKISHKIKDLGLTVSTKEFIVQKPHVNYRCSLSHIVSILPYNHPSYKQMDIVHEQDSRTEITTLKPVTGTYKLDIENVQLQNRSGIFQLGRTEMVIPIQKNILEAIVKYGQMASVPT